MRKTQQAFPVFEARDKEDRSWREEPVRHDPKTGAILYYLGFSHLGFTVRRLEQDGTWGVPFGLSKTNIQRTSPCALPAGVNPPC